MKKDKDIAIEIKENKPVCSIPVKTIVTIIISFILGIFLTILFFNLIGKEQITLTTYSVVSFMFTVGLGTASIVLAIIAIRIGKDSEEVLIRRSEEGIRLQNEVFVRTNEVLSKIQASTGLTERRIEDIISGRANIIVNEAIEKSLPKESRDFSKENINKIKKEIADSLKEQLGDLLSTTPSKAVEILDEKAAKQKKIEEVNDKWNKFRKSTIDKLKLVPNIKLVSESAGNINSEESDKFWDAILEINGKRVGLDFHTAEQINVSYTYDWKNDEGARNEFLRRVTWRMQQDNIPLVFLIFDNNIWDDPGMVDLTTKIENFHSINSKFNIIKMIGDPDSLVKQIMRHS